MGLVDLEDLICPITKEIFLNPVIADDGIVYEESAIKEWLEKKKISPMTNGECQKYTPAVMVKNIVSRYLENNPDKRELQFYEIKTYAKYRDVIHRAFKNGQWEKLMEYQQFDLPDFFRNCYDKEQIKNIPHNIMVHVLDNAIDLESADQDGWTPIHFICNCSTPEMIKYIIDKGVNLESAEKHGWRPIHFICHYQTPEIIKYIIDKGVNLEYSNKDGWQPIHFICRYQTPEIIKYIIDKGVDLEYANKDGSQPIHFICRYSTPEMIKYIIDKGVDLEYANKAGWQPFHYICYFSTPEMIKYIIDKGVDLECYDGWRPIHYICYISTPEIIKYIIDKGVDLESADKHGWRPIHYICRYQTHEMIKYIIDKGVNLKSKILEDNKNETDDNNETVAVDGLNATILPLLKKNNKINKECFKILLQDERIMSILYD